MKILVWIIGSAVALLAILLLAFRLSPWPSVLVIRRAFDKGAAEASQALEKHVPPGVAAVRNETYDAADPDGHLDVFFPADVKDSDRALTTIVWIHGGAWISGTKDQIANYAKILAGHGYTVVGVDYSVAPGKTYPTQLRGVVLFCGPYDVRKVKLDGSFGGFLRTVLWSYSGTKDFMANQRFATASVVNYVTPEFPPAFVSAGNADPLEPQSREFADALASQGVPVDTLFFPKDYAPPLAHEYQFNLDVTAGREALDRTLAFLSTR